MEKTRIIKGVAGTAIVILIFASLAFSLAHEFCHHETDTPGNCPVCKIWQNTGCFLPALFIFIAFICISQPLVQFLNFSFKKEFFITCSFRAPPLLLPD